MRELTPPERLLIFDPKDGWEPLCKHLGKPIPDVPFPHVNDTEWLNEKLAFLMKQRFLRMMKWASVVLVPLVAAVVAFRRWY